MMPPKEQFDSTIAKILQRPEYARLKGVVTDFIESAKEAINQWIMNMLEKLDRSNSSIPAVSDKLSTLFILIGLFVIVVVIIFIIVKFSKTFEKNVKVKEILGEKIDDRTTPVSLRHKASAFEKDGDTRQAIRYGFIAILLFMHERRLLYLDETKTNQEIYNYLKKESFLHIKVFEYLADTFNSSWYGHKAYDHKVYETWCSNLDFLWNEVMEHEGKN
jgi:aromatic ring-opening dioxygenase LigB subunit